mmetsp:Transcript_30309/g.90298  ORF Transcript_30309/g.90298 Transcript_30309/m.90298 type:complete len:252 (+) Transcript_30309:1266-2021(+)
MGVDPPRRRRGSSGGRRGRGSGGGGFVVVREEGVEHGGHYDERIGRSNNIRPRGGGDRQRLADRSGIESRPLHSTGASIVATAGAIATDRRRRGGEGERPPRQYDRQRAAQTPDVKERHGRRHDVGIGIVRARRTQFCHGLHDEGRVTETDALGASPPGQGGGGGRSGGEEEEGVVGGGRPRRWRGAFGFRFRTAQANGRRRRRRRRRRRGGKVRKGRRSGPMTPTALLDVRFDRSRRLPRFRLEAGPVQE